jgi:hypothetical protein
MLLILHVKFTIETKTLTQLGLDILSIFNYTLSRFNKVERMRNLVTGTQFHANLVYS